MYFIIKELKNNNKSCEGNDCPKIASTILKVLSNKKTFKLYVCDECQNRILYDEG